MRIRDWSSDVCSSDLDKAPATAAVGKAPVGKERVEGASAAPGFAADAALCALADCDPPDLEALLFALGDRRHGTVDGQALFQRRGARRKSPGEKAPADSAPEDPAKAAASTPGRKGKPRPRLDPAQAARKAEARRREEQRMADSPFAILRRLSLGGE